MTLHNTAPSIEGTDNTNSQNAHGSHTEKAKKRVSEASILGLVARWSYEFGFVSVHDPTTGEWHDLPTNDAPPWAKRESFKRKELKKQRGIVRMLTQSEMEKIWEAEQSVKEEEGIVEEHPIEEED